MLSRSEYIAIDTETNGLDVRDGRGYAYGVSLSDGKDSFYLPFRHAVLPYENLDLQEFKPLLQELLDTKHLIFHNAKFDIVSLGTLGLSARRKQFFDTMILAHLVDENRPFQGKKLDACAKHYLNNEGKRKDPDYVQALSMWGYARMSASVTAAYAATDALLTHQLYIKLVPLLKDENLREMWEHKRRFIELLIDMEAAGIDINTQLCEDMAEQGTYEMARIQHSLNGLLPSSPTDLETLLINRLSLPVVKTTPKGKPCFDKWAMEDYSIILDRINNPLAKKVLAYRGWQKAVSSYYIPYVEKRSPDSRLRPNYKLHGTVTGRMSCAEPNLQQIPRQGEKPWNGQLKRAFVPRQGYVLMEGDYSQLEARLGAAFAKEERLLEIFRDPERDLFKEMGKALKMERYLAKTLNYTISYGGGRRRVSYVFGVSQDEAEGIINNYYRTYPRLRRASQYAQRHVEMRGYMPIWSGRRRHFTKPKDDAHKAFNSACQGGAADVVERTMLRLADQGYNNDDCRMLLQIHDSVVFEIREDLVDEVVRGIQKCMEDVTPDFGVPLKADCHPWSE